MNEESMVNLTNLSKEKNPALQKLADKIRKEAAGIFPYLMISVESGLGDSVFIKGSFQPKEKWSNGIFQNSDWFHMWIHSIRRNYIEGDTMEFDPHQFPRFAKGKLRKKKTRDQDEMAAYVVSQLKKLAAAKTSELKEEVELDEMKKPDLNKPAFKVFGKAGKHIQDGKCPLCSAKINAKDFKDETSKKEYSISGMCQKCQDKIFGD